MLDLKIAVKPVYKKKTFTLSEDALNLLSQYHTAAVECLSPDTTENEVLEAILKQHVLKDKKFKEWQKNKIKK